jgi:hypothetical protein
MTWPGSQYQWQSDSFTPPPPPPPAPPPTPQGPSAVRRNLPIIVPWVLTAGLAVALLLVLLLPKSPSSSPPPPQQQEQAAATAQDAGGDTGRNVIIRFTLYDLETAGASCRGQGGYSDIAPGAPVTVKNESGEILGAGTLGVGSSVSGTCIWSVQLSGVPSGEKFYSAEVGDRGAITYSEAELAAADWTFELSLGD